MIGNRKLKKKMYEWNEKYANKVGYKFGSDKGVLDYMLGRLLVKLKNLGRRYCPRRIVTGIEEEDIKVVYPYVYL